MPTLPTPPTHPLLTDHERLDDLLAHGADPDDIDKNGLTALHHAAAAGDVESMQILLHHAASFDEKDEGAGCEAPHEVFPSYPRNKWGYTPLH